jgi:transposase
MDLHRNNSMVVAMCDQTGEHFPARRLDNDRTEELWQYLDSFDAKQIRVVLEATGNSRWRYRLLKTKDNVEPVVVVPQKVRIIAETLSKSDRIDAEALAYLSTLNALPRSWVPDEDVEELRELTRHRAALVRRRTQAKNQISGVLTRCGVRRPYADVFGIRGRAWLEQIPLPNPMRYQVDVWLASLDHTVSQIEKVERILYGRLAKSDRWSEDVELLRTIPGVGMLTALTILAELGDYTRFRRRSEVASFAGLIPKSKRSNQTVRYGRLTRRGPAALRTILVEVSLHGARGSIRYGRLYEKFRSQKRPNAGKAAVARQMLEDAWTMLRKRQPFREPIPNPMKQPARVG